MKYGRGKKIKTQKERNQMKQDIEDEKRRHTKCCRRM